MWIAVLFGMTCLQAEEVAPETGEPPVIRQLRETLQANLEGLPEVIPNLTAGASEFETIDLTASRTEIEGRVYHAFRFRIPEEGGREFLWAFRAGEAVEQWYIFAEEGRMEGFTRFERRPLMFKGVEGVAEKGDLMILQRLPEEALEPGRSYIIWFRLGEEAEPKVTCSVNLLPVREPEWRFAEVFAMLY